MFLQARAAAVILAALLLASAAAASWSRPALVEARAVEVAPVYLPFTVGGRPPSECEPAYPTLCFPSPPPDLDCPEVAPSVNFPVLPPDPHGFDTDKDGIGCESP